MTNHKNIPALRFKEFVGEWEVKKLGEVGTYYNGLTGKTKENFGSGKPFIKYKQIFDNSRINLSQCDFVEIFENEKQKKAQYGDIFFTTSSETPLEVGFASVLLDEVEELYLNSFSFGFRPKSFKILVPKFAQFLFRSEGFRKEVVKLAQGSTRFNMSKVQLMKTKILVPCEPEQQKIANFLTAIDKKIQQLREKHRLLEAYKKGIMQQIFKQDIRFKDDDGGSFGDWEVKRLGEITQKVGKKNKENIQYPIYSINNKEGFLPQADQFDGLDSNDRGYDISLYKIVHKNTFAYNPARINVGSIGYSGNLENVIISSLYICFKTTSELDDRYLLQYLDTFDFNKNVIRNSEGGVRQYLFYENFSGIKIPLPSLKEQQKIANFLSSIDLKIGQVRQQVESMEGFKKGLLQVMFV